MYHNRISTQDEGIGVPLRHFLCFLLRQALDIVQRGFVSPRRFVNCRRIDAECNAELLKQHLPTG